MPVSWNSLTCTPNSDALSELRTSWSWLLPSAIEPVLFSIFGDVFFRAGSESVHWLNTGTGEISQVSETLAEFQEMLGSEKSAEWFLPALVEKLHAAEKVPASGHCYTYAILPVFAEGKFEEWNFKPVPARDHFAATAKVLKEIANLPDGARVHLSVVE